MLTKCMLLGTASRVEPALGVQLAFLGSSSTGYCTVTEHLQLKYRSAGHVIETALCSEKKPKAAPTSLLNSDAKQ